MQEAADKYEGDKSDMKGFVSRTVVPIAEEKGFSFSADDYIKYLQTEVKNRLANIPVSDDEISGVTGGVSDVELSGDTGGDVVIVDKSVNVTQINIIITGETSPDSLRAIGQALSGK